MDALETANQKKTISRSSRRVLTSKVLESAADARVELRKSVALGTDFRLESPILLGAGLEFENHILQMSIFQKNGQVTHSRGSRVMAPASRRRNRVGH